MIIITWFCDEIHRESGMFESFSKKKTAAPWGVQLRESIGFARPLSAHTAQKTPEIHQVFPEFSVLFERKIAPAKLLGTAKREILASGKATGAGILAMYSEHRQRHLAREGPFCGCRIPNLHTLKRPDAGKHRLPQEPVFSVSSVCSSGSSSGAPSFPAARRKAK